MPSYTRSSRYNKKSSSRGDSSPIKAKPYADMAENWMMDDSYSDGQKIVQELDVLSELREYRDPYANRSDITYEIPFGVFYNLFGLEYSVCENLIKEVNGVKYLCI